MIKYFFYKIGKILASSLSLKTAYFIAACLSDIQYMCCPKDRAAVRDNLRVICGSDTDVRPLSREVFRNFGRYLVEFFRMETVTQEFICSSVDIENQHFLNEALARGKGVIIMTAHLGNWEMGGVLLGKLGYPCTAVALPHKERPVNELFDRQRSIGGVTVVPTRFAFRRCLRTLRHNGIVALLADRDFGATGQIMDFFGRGAMIPRGASMLVYRTGAAVVPMFLIRQADGRFRIVIRPALDVPEEPQAMAEKDFSVLFMRKQIAVLEAEIRAHPSQWMMFRRFWVTPGAGPERIVHT